MEKRKKSNAAAEIDAMLGFQMAVRACLDEALAEDAMALLGRARATRLLLDCMAGVSAEFAQSRGIGREAFVDSALRGWVLVEEATAAFESGRAP